MRIAQVGSRAAVLLAMVFAAPMTWVAPQAEACSCLPRTPDEEIAAGRTLAIATRTGGTPEAPRFRIERTAGPGLSARGEVRIGPGGICGDESSLHDVRAFYLREEDERLVAQGCGFIDLGPVLTRTLGAPVATSTADPVAVLTGHYGTSTLAAIDANGDVVAWDGRPSAYAVAACRGGRSVAALRGREDSPADVEVTVHDARTLALLWRRNLPEGREDGLKGLRCDDTGVQVLLKENTYTADYMRRIETYTRLVTVTPRGVDDRRLPSGPGSAEAELGSTQALSTGGFLGVEQDYPRSHLVRITPDGRALRPTTFDGVSAVYSMTVSPDGRTGAAVVFSPASAPARSASETGGGRSEVLIFDVQSGEVLRRWAPDELPSTVTWSASGNLIARIGFRKEGGYYKYTRGSLVTLDRTLRQVRTVPGPPSNDVAAVGETVLGFGYYGGHNRLTLIDRQGHDRTVDNLWLAATTQVVALPPVVPAVAVSTDDRLPWVLGGLASVVLGLAAAARRKGTR